MSNIFIFGLCLLYFGLVYSIVLFVIVMELNRNKIYLLVHHTYKHSVEVYHFYRYVFPSERTFFLVLFLFWGVCGVSGTPRCVCVSDILYITQ